MDGGGASPYAWRTNPEQPGSAGHGIRTSKGVPSMKTWRKPKIVEIAVGTEINAYACADL
ncbi:pyrroloquinoline quinone precursor peptide PqqA [Azospirillum sp. TSO22-1]|uniref:pyrroloquinoline quinone precursor peptide PqqA n=1 Tax=Azospirillum sp. TSO22-1 TaxID=716789 RepID=UPI0032B3EA25